MKLAENWIGGIFCLAYNWMSFHCMAIFSHWDGVIVVTGQANVPVAIWLSCRYWLSHIQSDMKAHKKPDGPSVTPDMIGCTSRLMYLLSTELALDSGDLFRIYHNSVSPQDLDTVRNSSEILCLFRWPHEEEILVLYHSSSSPGFPSLLHFRYLPLITLLDWLLLG